MSINPQSKLFGSALKTRVLTAIALVEDTYPSEIARLAGANLFSVQRILDALEQEGIIATRKPGVERRVTLNPRYFALSELKSLLLRLGSQDKILQDALARRRARPRRRNKEL